MSRIEDFIRAAGKDLIAVPVRFSPNGASNPVAASTLNGQEIASIVHTGTGVFTITFVENYAELVGFFADIMLNANLDLKTQFGPYTPASPSTGVKASIILNILAVNVLTDIAANANNLIACLFLFRRTSFQP